MTLLEVDEQADEMLHIVALACHQVAATHIQPLELWQMLAKLGFDGVEHFGQVVRGRLAQGMEVEALNAVGQVIQPVGGHTEARTWGARVIDVGLDDRAHGVDAQAAADAVSTGSGIVVGYAVLKTAKLVNRVERDVRAAAHELLDGLIGVGWAIGVRQAVELVIGQQHLVDRTGGGADAVLPEDWKGAPQGIGLERHDNLHTGLAADPCDEVEVASQL